MLKHKLDRQTKALDLRKPESLPTIDQKFYAFECKLNEELAQLELPKEISCVYNPVEYASDLHCAYLKKYLSGTKNVVFIGINPGPKGMCQTGIPFGNVGTIRNKMQLSGEVQQPPLLHAKRPVTGLNCRTEEQSGLRLWNLFEELAGSLDVFFQQCFVHNLCPLAFFDEKGGNVTPDHLKGEYKTLIRDKCLMTLEKQLELLRPQFVVAIGSWIEIELKKRSSYCKSNATVIRLKHPSMRVPNNTKWAEEAKALLEEKDLIKYICNKP
ncbi:PREDICTED: single-strand selective monofunctional uracil DNA glycosylase [Drosophila arizonae]|uniref:Single-strand selective monofunctional uracil DNA glycosylase n=1 Tax=Drosophila arizonae TaxID=7263 RepID=A0ABM1NME1_DROAR|nr:PREDICTED: single-strand selective monofunctional uracil DNA glycosylase [Drosophila arizonae]